MTAVYVSFNTEPIACSTICSNSGHHVHAASQCDILGIAKEFQFFHFMSMFSVFLTS